MASPAGDVRVGVDIGGTFTDIAVQIGSRSVTTKVLTTPRAPEQAVLQGIAQALAEAGVTPAEVDLVIHGTTLATNALIERKGARTALRHHRGLSRHARDRLREPLRAVRHLHREARAAGAARPALHRARAHRAPRAACCCRSTRRRSAALAESCRPQEVESLADRLPARYANPGARAARCARSWRKQLPGCAITLSLRGLPRGARVRALLDDLRQRLCPAADGALSRAACEPSSSGRASPARSI